MTNNFIATQSAARIANYDVQHIRRLVRQGRIKGARFGPAVQVDRASLQQYLDEQTTKGERRGPKPANREGA